METLYPYQVEGAKWLASKKYALLADEMRLGKTPIAIRAADLIDAKPILVLCPAIARINWSREFAKFSRRTLSSFVHLTGRKPSISPSFDIAICSYDLLQSSAVLSHLRARRYALIILDESHYLKTPSAARTKAILSRTGLVHQADRVWCLTGTPAPNNASELWTTLYVFRQTELGYSGFLREFCTGYESPYGFRITGNKNVSKLREILKPIMLRRTKEQVRPDLPRAQYSEYVVQPAELNVADVEAVFNKRTEALHEGVGFVTRHVEAGFKILNAALAGKENSPEELLAALAANTRHTATLRQCIGLLKAPRVVELVKEELENGLFKIVIFAIHVAAIKTMQEGLALYQPLTIWGGTPPAKRDRALESFKNNDKNRVMIANIQAGGVAIDLSAAHDVIFAEADWVPANNAQAAARVDGPNQKQPINIRFISLAGTIDEVIQRTLRRKTEQLAKIFDQSVDVSST